ncbi:MAG: alpha/beta hydrolase [Actinomycetota bacterium]
MSRSIPTTVTSTDQVTVQLHDLGGSGPLLLLSHATGFCGQVWAPMAETLAEQYHCVAFDHRSHGRSSRPVGRSLEWSGMAEDIVAVVEALSPDEPVAAVGHSMGGTTLAIAEVARPGTVAKAWTFEPILFGGESLGTRSEPSEISQGARRRRATFADRDEVIARYGSRPPLDVLDPRALRAYAEHGFRDLPDGTVTLCCRPEDEAAVFEHHNSGARTTIGDVTIPFLIAASGDERLPAQAVRAAAAEFPHLDLAIYEDLTHFGPLEAPERMARDCLAWLAAN